MSLNDPRWGRASEEEPRRDDRPADEEPPRRSDGEENARPQDRRADQGREDNRRDEKAPQKKNEPFEMDEDLDRLWKDFSDMVQSVMGGKRPQRGDDLRSKLKSRDDFSRDDEPEAPQEEPRREEPRGEEPQAHRYGSGSGGGNGGRGRFGGLGNMDWRPRPPKAFTRGTGIGMTVLLGCAFLAWCSTGFYIVPEGQSGIVTTFGRYTETTAPGFRWHLPYPIQDKQLVDVSSVRTAEIGFAGRSDRLREALMLTDDENIVDVQFTVQYRIKPGDGAKDYVFRIRQPDLTVTQAAESAMREVVGRKTMDSVLFESKAEIAEAVKRSMQSMLDRYSSGIEVMSVAIQNAQPPQQVQAAFNDAVKAGQDRERSINLGEAYRNAIIPKAEGTAARLKEEAYGYQARMTETARGDADRFTALYSEYKKAPEVTRDRLYVDTVRDVMKNVSKVYIDAKSGSNLLYLPLDRIVSSTRSAALSEAQKTEPAAELPAQGTAAPETAAEVQKDVQRMLRER